ncbi:carboxylate-amine ligase [Amycolatopsis bartoniae]|uniref:Putative glutamate--cysteine ligase 2 n=1 Tax=Amycolatopsis bartoniae TaxID=941986 RepID=A0A8H9MF21_9PSEU|nr:glutamate--cysteine ligase [Amycolatopsis bartoniae]MBB2937600.1 carboxylate-amine ligase [Amycolatopsis bartoniae]TVS99987.1 glutamate--cysteine ligase [Amycolatopsis bartoniae]GHF82482.1 putative glutamate--cysteine ligase 2 [Amycolatopsis bartoniae]
MHIDFSPSRRSTVGAEWELALVDRRSGELSSVAERILEAVRPDGQDEHPKIKQELLLNTIEIITGVCDTVGEIAADLTESLDTVHSVIDPLGVELFCAGTHPFSPWYQQKVTDKARYQKLIDRTQWWGRQMLIYGVHVHVGLDSRAKVLPVLDALLNYAPHLQALSASSPYWGAEDTGYASNRALMFQQLPTAGLPFQFREWSELENYVDDMFKTGVIDAFSEIRWDIRPAPHFGTIEMRVCDGLPTLEEVTAIAALTQCLVDDFSRRLDDGEQLPCLPPWHVQENKWRAARYGLDAIVILDAAGKERLVTEDIWDVLDRLEPVARRLGCVAELRGVETILRYGASYQRQRAVAKEHNGSLKAVVASLVAEMRDGIPK